MSSQHFFATGCGRISGVLIAAWALATAAGAQTETNTPPAITSLNGDQTVYEGDFVTLSVTATGTAPLSYFWSLNGTNQTRLTNSVVMLSSVTTNDAGSYQVVVSNAFGTVTSPASVLTVLPGVPRILIEPDSQTVVEGSLSAVGVTAVGNFPLYYYWWKDGQYFTNSSGPSIVWSPITTNDAGIYQVQVSNVLGIATSQLATVAVKPNTPRQLRTTAISVVHGATNVTVPIQFAAQGNENLLSFSLDYDPTVLGQPVASLAADAVAALPNATFTVNESETAVGHLGISVALPAGATMPTQTFWLADVQFTITGPDWAQGRLNFGSSPVALQASDAGGGALPVLDFIGPVLIEGTIPATVDPQSGLFHQQIALINPGAIEMDGLQVLVRGLTNDTLGHPIRVQNATDSTNNVPFVFYGALNPGAAANLDVEFYVSDRRTLPTPEYEPQIVPPRVYTAGGGVLFTITATRYHNGTMLVEFQTIAGRQYYIQYADALSPAVWKTAMPPITGTGSRVQWIDAGPPKTDSVPADRTSRFYRGMLMP